MSNSLQKKEIRKTHLKKRLNYDNQNLSIFSNEILKKLECLEIFKQAKNIMFYIPIKNEVNTIPSIKKYLKTKQISLPKIKSDNKIHAHLINSLENLEIGKYNIEEPNDETLEIDLGKLDIIIIPGISFDRQGLRIGYGKGYYDDFLKSTKAKKIALAYEFQINENIPGEIHDEKVDLIITEKSIIKTN
jgi:5-formyltetrahydrofolate cyclo-ligase